MIIAPHTTRPARRCPGRISRPDQPRTGLFVVLEGISGSGKSTLAALIARRLACPHFHTVPAPLSDLQPYINEQARALPQLAFYLTGALHASDLARHALTTGHAVADRYISSVIANHAAVHDLRQRHRRRSHRAVRRLSGHPGPDRLPAHRPGRTRQPAPGKARPDAKRP